MADQVETRLITPEFRVFFPELLAPRAFKDLKTGRLGEPKYSVTMAFDPSVIADLTRTAGVAARAKFGNLPAAEIAWPLKRGDILADKAKAKNKNRESWRGLIILAADSLKHVSVCDAKGQDIIDAKQLYSGCYGRAEINFFAYENGLNENKPSVKAYLNAFIKTRDGERIGGRDAKTVFAGIIGETTTADPFRLDEEIPF